jgi:hypothetical protein
MNMDRAERSKGAGGREGEGISVPVTEIRLRSFAGEWRKRTEEFRKYTSFIGNRNSVLLILLLSSSSSSSSPPPSLSLSSSL